MTDQYYIRIRGRVQGPFDSEKLRTLARRGQFSRLHEISLDGNTWTTAKDYPDFFQGASQPIAEARGATSSSTAQTPTMAATPKTEWFYLQGGQTRGPVEQSAFVSMVLAQQLPIETEVWKDGMTDWIPANRVSGLLPMQSGINGGTQNPSVHSSNNGSVSSSEKVDTIVIRSLTEGRPWVNFLAIMGYIWGALAFCAAILSIILAARAKAGPLLASGLFQLIWSLVVLSGASFLHRHVQAIYMFERNPTEKNLAAALTRLKTFWLFVGIVTIVCLTMLLIFAVVLFSMLGTLPDFR